jgi:hypothetical protein
MTNFSKPVNINYAATIVKLESFVNLPNCDSVHAAFIFGCSVIVSKTAKIGDVGVFFPVECQLGHEFISNNNLYRKAEHGNVDPNVTGYFDVSRRVKAVKFRGHKSEGFFMPLSSLTFTGVSLDDFVVGTVFDKVGNFEICRKYCVAGNTSKSENKTRAKKADIKDVIVDGQFKFHYDTENLRRNAHKISPNDIISITDKWHGTSAVTGKVLIQRKLSFVERILYSLGVAIETTTYGLVYSSRRVVKGVNNVDKSDNVHFYGTNVWGNCAKNMESRILNGFTLYYEIVGYTENNRAIQSGKGGKAYSYGCAMGTHRALIYRITTTNVNGKVIELSYNQMKEYCSTYGLEPVKELFYGKASELVPFTEGVTDIRDWQRDFVSYLENRWVNDGDCIFNPGLPAEGIVVRVDHLHKSECFKLKNFRFLEQESKELDLGVQDMETQESITEE